MTDDLHPELKTSLSANGDRALLRVAGEIDLGTARDFAEALLQATDAAASIDVDLVEVAFMDSTGLRALLEARKRAQAAGGGVALAVRDGSPVARLLDLAGVADLFGSFEKHS
jgi:anti-sigma B factor antagonist